MGGINTQNRDPNQSHLEGNKHLKHGSVVGGLPDSNLWTGRASLPGVCESLASCQLCRNAGLVTSLIAVAKILSRKQLQNRALLCRSLSITAGKAWWLQCEGTGHITSLGSREMDACVQLSLPFYSLRTPACDGVALIQAFISRNILIQTPRDVFPWWSWKPTKLTKEINLGGKPKCAFPHLLPFSVPEYTQKAPRYLQPLFADAREHLWH